MGAENATEDLKHRHLFPINSVAYLARESYMGGTDRPHLGLNWRHVLDVSVPYTLLGHALYVSRATGIGHALFIF